MYAQIRQVYSIEEIMLKVINCIPVLSTMMLTATH